MKIARAARPPLAMQALRILRAGQGTAAQRRRIKAVQEVILTGLVDTELSRRHQPQFRAEARAVKSEVVRKTPPFLRNIHEPE